VFAGADAVAFLLPLAWELSAMEVGHAVDEVVDRVPERVRDGVGRARELVGRDHEAAAAEVGAVEPEGQVEQRVVALVADALDDLADGRRDVRVDLEVTGLEPLPPLTEVEEPSDQRSSAAS
jgi:hypothetical protein